MRLPCRLRPLRGDSKLADFARASGVAQPHLSEIERGIRLPADSELEGLERVYGVSREQFYEVWAASNGGRMLVELTKDEE